MSRQPKGLSIPGVFLLSSSVVYLWLLKTQYLKCSDVVLMVLISLSISAEYMYIEITLSSSCKKDKYSLLHILVNIIIYKIKSDLGQLANTI